MAVSSITSRITSGITINPRHVLKLVLAIVLAIVLDGHDFDYEHDNEREYDASMSGRGQIVIAIVIDTRALDDEQDCERDYDCKRRCDCTTRGLRVTSAEWTHVTSPVGYQAAGKYGEPDGRRSHCDVGRCSAWSCRRG